MASKALAQLRRAARDAERALSSRPALIEQARKDGETWETIAAAANMSRAGVIKLHNSSK